jgi:hypothetical protein
MGHLTSKLRLSMLLLANFFVLCSAFADESSVAYDQDRDGRQQERQQDRDERQQGRQQQRGSRPRGREIQAE